MPDYPHIRKPYDQVDQVMATGGGPSKTRQEQRDSADINRIVALARRGLNTPQASGTPRYGDFTLVEELQESLERVDAAADEFMTLPPAVRDVAGGTPLGFARMLTTQDGVQQLVDAGLHVEGVEPTPPPVKADPAPAGSPAERSEDEGTK